MRKLMVKLLTVLFIATFFNSTAFAGNSMEGHDMASKDKIGDLIHESVVDGYMFSYYFMDLRDQKTDHADKEAMDKPHHLMVYIMNKSHKPVLEGKVGFLIKGEDGNTQKEMGKFMSEGFGITADMKKKGTYKITTKAVVDKNKFMDSFNYQIK